MKALLEEQLSTGTVITLLEEQRSRGTSSADTLSTLDFLVTWSRETVESLLITWIRETVESHNGIVALEIAALRRLDLPLQAGEGSALDNGVPSLGNCTVPTETDVSPLGNCDVPPICNCTESRSGNWLEFRLSISGEHRREFRLSLFNDSVVAPCRNLHGSMSCPGPCPRVLPWVHVPCVECVIEESERFAVARYVPPGAACSL